METINIPGLGPRPAEEVTALLARLAKDLRTYQECRLRMQEMYNRCKDVHRPSLYLVREFKKLEEKCDVKGDTAGWNIVDLLTQFVKSPPPDHRNSADI